MAVAFQNGHNGHNGHNKTQFDLGLPESSIEKPCLERLGHGSWCNLPQNHTGNHEGPAPEYGPVERRPALWRRHKGFDK